MTTLMGIPILDRTTFDGALREAEGPAVVLFGDG